ncbi:MAG: hypothetical protein MUC98_12385, partial [Desulfobacterota bacterium]|nr:hypothetical protein [Thermodesulfobacteriota bacterium]
MEQTRQKSDAPAEAGGIRRGTQAGLPLHVALVGGGKACSDLLHLLDSERLSRLNIRMLGVFDKSPQAPGVRYAKELGLFVTDRLESLFSLPGLNLLIELTGIAAVQSEVYSFIVDDSDGDGLPDSFELAYTSPASATSMNPGDDSDTDGLTNLQEYQRGTLPNNPDTDGDTLRDGPEVAGAGA